MVRRTLLLLLAVLLLAGTLRAQDDTPDFEELKKHWESLSAEERAEKIRLYERHWKNLPEEERLRRMLVFEEHLKDLTPGEREELLKKLRRIRERGDLEKLREKSERLNRYERKFLEKLPEPLAKRIGELPADLRSGLIRHATCRVFDAAGKDFEEHLTREERKRLSGFHGRDRFRVACEIDRARVLAGLEPAERRRIEALSAEEREKAVDHHLKKVQKTRFDRARRACTGEIQKLLALPAERLREKLKRFSGRRGGHRGWGPPPIEDEDLLRRIRALPREQQGEIFRQLRGLESKEDREAFLEKLRAELPK